MFDILIDKYKINKYSMLKNGTIAVITMFSVAIFFGYDNIMLAFPIALTSIVLGRQNIYVKPIGKVSRIMFIDLIIVVFAFLSTLNIYTGIFINLISIFLIMYVITTPYDPTFYKPFIMMYVFTQYSSIPIDRLPNRLLSVIFGVSVLLICNVIFSKVNEKNILGNIIIQSLNNINIQIHNITEQKYDNKITLETTNSMRELAYKIYVTRYRRYLTTLLGKIQFKFFITIEYLNLYLNDINLAYKNNEIGLEELEFIRDIIGYIIGYGEGKNKKEEVENKINKYVNKYKNKSKISSKVSCILIIIINNIREVEKLDTQYINDIYTKWDKGDFDKFKVTFKEYFNKDTIRFKFAMRMSVTLTVAIFFAEILGFYKTIWAIITIMSIMQPYYEDTITKGKERVRGNVLAILFTGIFINIVNIRAITIIILIVSLYLLYGFKEYYKISLFAGIASISIASLTSNINQILFFRIIYVIIGVLTVIVANKLVFPYTLKDGIRALEIKIKRYNKELLKEGEKYLLGGENEHILRDIIIHSTLMSQKLYLRNLQYGDESVEKFLDYNNNLVIRLGFEILMSYGKNSSVKEVFLKIKREQGGFYALNNT